MIDRQPDARARLADLSPARRALLESWLTGRHAGARAGAIPRRTAHDAAPLSSAQERLWFLDQYEPANPTYNRPLALCLAGSLDIVALERSLSEIVRCHDILRTTFPSSAGQPRQVVTPPSSIALAVVDLPPCAEGQRETAIRRCMSEEGERPFDLVRGPLWRALLLHLDDDAHILLITLHHIISDGWSDGVLSRELGTLYNTFVTAQPATLPDLPIQYADYASWQRERLAGGAFDKHLAYWRDHLAGAPTVLDLPTDRPRPSTQTFHGATYSTLLPTDVMAALKRLSQDENTTLYMTLLAAFQTLLHRYTGRDDLLVGSPIAGRTRVETEPLIGFFVNTLVLRGDLSGDPTFIALLARTRATTLAAYDHQDLPFERLVAELQPPRDPSRNPLVQVLFALQNARRANLELTGLTVQSLDVDTKTAKFDLSLSITDTPEGAHAAFEYNTDLFDAGAIERLSCHVRTLLEGVVADPNRPISALPLLTGAERRQLLVDWNDTRTDYPRDACIHELFAARAARTPDASAVVYEDEQLTYRALDERANRLAHYLQQLGVGPDVLVGICVERSIEMVVALLGILKAGGAYLPLDLAYPHERLTFMLQDSQAPVLLTQQRLRDRLPAYDGAVVLIDADAAAIAAAPAEAPPCVAPPATLAYVLYTSGSTGRPKGVQVPHRALTNLLASMRGEPGITAADTLLAVTTLSFDIAALELYLPLIAGARLVVVSRDVATDGTRLGAALSRSGATVMQATPATWRILLEAGWQGSATLTALCGGEAMPRALADALLPRVKALWNMYGPTETTIWSTIQHVQRDDAASGPISIGRPIANTAVYILDGRLQPVPIGVPGELHIGGAGLARGYLNRPALTAETFIPHPFDGEPGARLYKTGDLARYRANGAIEFLGRRDHQIKLRGYRIETGEIEAILRQHPTVDDAVVLTREDNAGEVTLVAYVVRAPALGEIAAHELRRTLSRSLPAYMVPHAVIALDALPLTPNGKLDRRALPSPDRSDVALEREYVAPADELERRLGELWERVLDVRPIGVADNFFDLGGHSLLAVKLLNDVAQEIKWRVPLATFFEGATVTYMARLLREQQGDTGRSPLVALQPHGSRPPFFCIHPPDGSIAYYRLLAQYIGQDQPVYGVQARATPVSGDAALGLEDLATTYARDIRAFQPEGPYTLGGYSAGGMLAFEIARQLRVQGQTVALLVLFDTLCPGVAMERPAPPYAPPLRDKLSYHAAIWVGLRPRDKLAYVQERARGIGRRVALHNRARGIGRHAAALWAPRRRVESVQGTTSNVESVQGATGNVVGAPAPRAPQPYVPRAYPGAVTIFLGAQTQRDAPDQVDPRLRWRQLARDGLETHWFPGDHYAIMLEPVVARQVAARLRACLATAQENAAAR